MHEHRTNFRDGHVSLHIARWIRDGLPVTVHRALAFGSPGSDIPREQPKKKLGRACTNQFCYRNQLGNQFLFANPGFSSPSTKLKYKAAAFPESIVIDSGNTLAVT